MPALLILFKFKYLNLQQFIPSHAFLFRLIFEGLRTHAEMFYYVRVGFDLSRFKMELMSLYFPVRAKPKANQGKNRLKNIWRYKI